MEKYFTLLADYNRRANEAMYEILSAQDKEELTKECGSYYRSIDGIVRHLCQSDLTWLSRIKAAFGDLGTLSGVDPERLGPQGASDLPALKKIRAELDQLFEKLAAELTDAHLSREFV
ncbi:DinB family protein, partial [Salinispira pacifica]